MKKNLILTLTISFLHFACSDEPKTNKSSVDMTKDIANDIVDIDPDLPKKKEFERCEKHSDCERGLVCPENRCNVVIGCRFEEVRPSLKDTGCFVEKRGTDIFYAKECNTNDECKNSEFGKNCVRHVCTNQTPCTTDDQCPENQECWSKIVYLDQQ